MILSKTALRVATATIAAGFATAAISTSAFADWRRDRDHHHHWHRGPAVYAAPPVIYAPPATVYEPVAPPPLVGLGVDIRLR